MSPNKNLSRFTSFLQIPLVASYPAVPFAVPGRDLTWRPTVFEYNSRLCQLLVFVKYLIEPKMTGQALESAVTGNGSAPGHGIAPLVPCGLYCCARRRSNST
jgi:hypothetical protein